MTLIVQTVKGETMTHVEVMYLSCFDGRIRFMDRDGLMEYTTDYIDRYYIAVQ